MATVVTLVYDRLAAFEFGIATELFSFVRPELPQAAAEAWYDFHVVSVDGTDITMHGGVRMTAPADLSIVDDATLVIIPGWRIFEPAPHAMVEAVLRAHRHGARIMSICSGVFPLAQTGLLDGRSATTHWRYSDRLATEHPRINVRPDVLFVDEGDVLTSAGSAAAIDLGLHIITADYGAAAAQSIARSLVVDYQRPGGQAQYLPNQLPETSGERLHDVIQWALAHLEEDLSVARLCQQAAMSERSFHRAFAATIGTSPSQWVTAQRIHRARELLESTELSIATIAAKVGFRSQEAFRNQFRRHTKTSPSNYRRAMSAVSGQYTSAF